MVKMGRFGIIFIAILTLLWTFIGMPHVFMVILLVRDAFFPSSVPRAAPGYNISWFLFFYVPIWFVGVVIICLLAERIEKRLEWM